MRIRRMRPVVFALFTFLPVYAVFAQQMPSHGASAAGSAPTVVVASPSRTQSHAAWRNDMGVELMFMPSPDDKRFDDALGVGLNITFPVQPALALRTGVAMESYSGKTGVGDADVVPLSLSFLMAPPDMGPVRFGLELGLVYYFVDFTDVGGDYDNAFGGVVGLNLASGVGSGFSVELGVGYRFDLSESQNDLDDDLSLEGLALKLGLRFSY